MAMLAILILPLSILGFTARRRRAAVRRSSSIQMPGRTASARSSIAYTSQTGNNGSAFAGFTGNTLWYNTTVGLAMLIGRYFVIIPMMAVAGSLVAKKIVPASAGTFPTHGAAVRRPAGRRDPDRRRPHLLPGAGARARSSSTSRCWPGTSSDRSLGVHIMETSQLRKRMPVSALADPKIVVPAHRRGVRQARSAHADQEPGDVRGRGRRGADHDPLHPRSRHAAAAISASPSRSSSGSGSRCCSPISPRPWPKAAARRRPNAAPHAHRDEGQAAELGRTRRTYKLVPAPA